MSERTDPNIAPALRTLSVAMLIGALIGSGCAHSTRTNLSGRVVDARGNGVWGAHVRLAGTSEQAVTAQDGHFRFDPLPPGTYLLTVKTQKQHARFQDSTRVREGRLTEVVLTLPDLAVLSRTPAGDPARVIQVPSGTIQGVVIDENGRTVPGAYVLAVEFRRAERTDGAGHFMLRGVPLGMHTLRVLAAGFEQTDQESLGVAEGDTVTVNLILRSQTGKPLDTRTGTIMVTVVSENGEALQYAAVFVLGAQTGGQTDRDGRVLIHHVPIGVYTVRAKMVGFVQMERESVRVTEGDTTTVDFKFRQAPAMERDWTVPKTGRGQKG